MRRYRRLTRSSYGRSSRRAARYFILASALAVTLVVLVAGTSASPSELPGGAVDEVQSLSAIVQQAPVDTAPNSPQAAPTLAAATAVAGSRFPAPTSVPLSPTAVVIVATTTPSDSPTATATVTATPSPSPTPTPSPTSTPSPTPTPSSPVPTSVGVAALEQPMLAAHNAERAAVGLPPLVSDARLVEIARTRAKDMIEKQYIGHVSPSGESAFTLLASSGVSSQMAAENLVVNGAPESVTVEMAMNGLMNSPGHRENILRPQFTRVGIGVATYLATKYYVIVFIAP